MPELETLIAGIIAGALAGMGLGGGSLLLIYLVAIKDMPQLQAQSLNLMFFFPAALTSVFFYIKNSTIDKKFIAFVALPGILGAVAGGLAAQIADALWLKKAFGLMLLYISVRELVRKT